MSETTPPLPLELLHLILTHAAASADMPTMRACTLVCRTFHAFCRPTLFAHIRLVLHKRDRFGRPLPAPRELREFGDMLKEEEGVGECVRGLVVSVQGRAGPDVGGEGQGGGEGGGGGGGGGGEGPPQAKQHAEYLDACTLIASFLPALHNLQELVICRALAFLPPCLSDALVECLLTRRITHFVLNDVRGFDVRWLNGMVGLRVLDVLGVPRYPLETSGEDAGAGGGGGRGRGRGKIHLDALRTCSRDLVEWILRLPASRLDISRVSRLWWKPFVFEGLVRLVDFAGTLRCLEVATLLVLLLRSSTTL